MNSEDESLVNFSGSDHERQTRQHDSWEALTEDFMRWFVQNLESIVLIHNRYASVETQKDIGLVISLKSTLPKIESLLASALMVLAILAAGSSCRVEGYTFSQEYQRYVHNYVNSGSLGNWTYLEKPTFPVLFNTSQIQIGENWSIVCPLKMNHSYHVYCYGKWVNNGSEPKTDYDIYVYNPLGEMERYHTESAGLPEHLGTTVDDPFFVPKYSGNYTFVICNDPKESHGAEQATFMIVEDIECNVWQEHYVEGKGNDDLPVLNTSWAYEFVTESKHIEVWIKVPDTLDMYEARLYLMADPKSGNKTILNGVPLAWEPGLYGDRNNLYGGYNLESKEYRGVAFASCEFFGQDMFLNYTSPNSGKSLYHLVLIGEVGSGTVEFLVKTEFKNACLKTLTVPTRVHPNNDTVVSYRSNSTDLEVATLEYSIDSWINYTLVDMEILSNRTCSATIPGQSAGTVVNYRVEANDTLRNILVANGSYPVKNELVLNVSLGREVVTQGENVTVRGNTTSVASDIPIIIYFNSANGSKQIVCYTKADGTFSVSFRPGTVGTWEVQARFGGDAFRYESVSSWLSVEVVEPSILVKYSYYIVGGMCGLIVVGAVIYWRKSKE